MKDYDKREPASDSPGRRRGVAIMLVLVVGGPLFLVSQLIILAVKPELAFPLVPAMGLTAALSLFLGIMWYTRCRNCGAFWPMKWSDARPDQMPGAGIVPPSKVHRCRRCDEPLSR